MNERNPMEPITNGLTAIASKPITGLSLGASATILHWIGWLTPYLTFITLLVGLAAGLYSFWHNRNLTKLDQLQIQQYKDLFEKRKKNDK